MKCGLVNRWEYSIMRDKGNFLVEKARIENQNKLRIKNMEKPREGEWILCGINTEEMWILFGLL